MKVTIEKKDYKLFEKLKNFIAKFIKIEKEKEE